MGFAFAQSCVVDSLYRKGSFVIYWLVRMGGVPHVFFTVVTASQGFPHINTDNEMLSSLLRWCLKTITQLNRSLCSPSWKV